MRRSIKALLPTTPFTISDAQQETLRTQGVVLLEGFYPRELVKIALECVAGQVDQVAHALHRAGKISDVHQGCSVLNRLEKIEKELPGASTFLHKNPDLSPAIKRLWAHPDALKAVSKVLGTKDILAIPNWNLRCKTPESASKNHATVPYHQDLAYGSEDAIDTYQLTSWVPFVPVCRANGPMQYVPGNFFGRGDVLKHTGCWKNTWYLEIPHEEIESHAHGSEEMIFDDMYPGDVLLFDNFVPHRSLPNVSSSTRWSVDLRWQDAKLPTGCGSPGIVLGENGDFIPYDQINWAASPVDHAAGWENAGKGDESLDRGLFSPLVSGPWMDRWEMTNVNEHVIAHREKSVPPLRRNPRVDCIDSS